MNLDLKRSILVALRTHARMDSPIMPPLALDQRESGDPSLHEKVSGLGVDA